MNLRDKNILVTGAGGFIGSHLAKRLVELNNNVKCFIRYNSRNDWGFIEFLPKEIRDNMEIIPSDLRDSDAVRDATEDVDVVFHLGSLISIPYSYLYPRNSIETNVIGTLNVLVASKENYVERIIHTSTSEVYGTAQYVPIDERHPLQAQSPYSASKIAADKIAESFYRSYNLPIAIIRPFNTYGPRQSARAIIPTIITQAIRSKKIYLGSLHPTRDFTYVEDVVDAFIKISRTKKAIGEVINVGSGVEISIRDLTYKILSLMDKKADIIIDKKRIRPQDSEVERLCADNTKARKILGWKPKINIDDGLMFTIDWISENIQIYKMHYTI
ncbi:MAG: NAD-dependent dehydratase [Candidatus Altiarchaeales archaeon]|nr:MAG: NAD-dependent dehydratase [Candidatus Asgardarchaeum californiense]RLI93307.1 MAG: NAD-dependent dehydratase [Candidatus Altiarchaeales archaeon]HDO82525.1 NAD-dependent epimerase/dehydratase family protein [Candidatus Altiarchaeales archaeon]HEX55174.1 NAD-dependent epimerase/dehydratase family protein [Candidatus Altiarchaeales archaeon]